MPVKEVKLYRDETGIGVWIDIQRAWRREVIAHDTAVQEWAERTGNLFQWRSRGGG